MLLMAFSLLMLPYLLLLNVHVFITGERVWSSETVQDSGELDREFEPR